MAFNSDKYINVLKKNIDSYIDNLQDINENCEEMKKYINGIKEKDLNLDKLALTKDTTYRKCEDLLYLEQLTIGLYGEWGSGKTHILKNLKYYYLNKDNTIPIFFDPWRYEKQGNILIPLLHTFLKSVEEYELRNKKKDIYKQLKSYISNFFSAFSIKTTIANVDLEFDLEKLFNNNEKSEESSKDIYLMFTLLLESIALKYGIYFVFLIDDLDRCLPESALNILSYTKSFFDTQYCIFVIAIDEEIIEKGIEYHYRDYFKLNTTIPISGYEYLEKIVTLPFRIPVISEEDLKQYLLLERQKNDTYKEFLSDEKLIDFLSKTIPPAPRKVKRALSLLSIKFELAKIIGFVSPDKILYAKLVLLELFTPQLFRFLKDNDYIFLIGYLVKWKGQSIEEREHKLSEIKDNNLTPKQKMDLSKLLEILKDIKERRIKFGLDKIDLIFEEELDEEGVRKYMEFKIIAPKNNINIKYITPDNINSLIDLLKEPTLIQEDIENYFKYNLQEIRNNNSFLAPSVLQKITKDLENINSSKKEIIFNAIQKYVAPEDIEILTEWEVK